MFESLSDLTEHKINQCQLTGKQRSAHRASPPLCHSALLSLSSSLGASTRENATLRVLARRTEGSTTPHRQFLWWTSSSTDAQAHTFPRCTPLYRCERKNQPPRVLNGSLQAAFSVLEVLSLAISAHFVCRHNNISHAATGSSSNQTTYPVLQESPSACPSATSLQQPCTEGPKEKDAIGRLCH